MGLFPSRAKQNLPKRETPQMPKEQITQNNKKAYNDSYFEAGRKAKSGAYLGVCEHFCLSQMPKEHR
ncbi:MAG: hypothetical protein IIV60_04165 [Alistipes sp.]|nr:hypothetical protein [Alistipes sp.]